MLTRHEDMKRLERKGDDLMKTEGMNTKGITKKLFTSESVSAGHPDKLADLISDSILDAVLTADPDARVACETLLSANAITLAGEITTSTTVDYVDIAYKTVKAIDPQYVENIVINNYIVEQSPDIAEGIADGGAGDQGLMFGYSTTQTPERLPLPIALAHRLIRKLDDVRAVSLPYLLADAKSQVTVEYGDNPRVHTVVISTRHEEDVDLDVLRKDVVEHVIKPVLGDLYDNKTIVHVNPAGSFVLGGPKADAGLTGRKIIVDTYGGYARHGGGAFSGKDATKVDRSGAYVARYIANHVVAAELARECEIQLSYAIGVAEPTSIRVDTFGTSGVSEGVIEKAIAEIFDLTPKGIIDELKLLTPIYRHTATGGHFGRDLFTWEQTPRATELLAKISEIVSEDIA